MTCALPLQDSAAGALFSPDRVHRFRLWRRWSSGPWACFLMLNPSAANETELDPTLRRCVGFAKAWDSGGLLVVNLFAVVSPDPRVLLTHHDAVGEGNDEAILNAASAAGIVVAGWGAFPEARDRAQHVMRMLREEGVPLYCLGTTKEGHPKHPLYLPASTMLAPFGGSHG